MQFPPLRFVFTEYYPANYINESGEAAGFFVDIIHEALETRMNIPVSVQVFPWKRCQAMVKKGEADLIATIPTAERLAYTYKVSFPLWIKKYHVYTWGGHPGLSGINKIQNIQSLKEQGLSVISYQGNSWSNTMLENAGVSVIYANSVSNMYRMLHARRGDVILDDPLLVDPMLRILKLDKDIFQTSGLAGESYFYPLISRKSPYVTIAENFAETLAEMQRDGTIDSIMKKYRMP